MNLTKIDTLLKSRYHGAANIRGIRYQLLYSLLCAFQLYDQESEISSIQFEGIEDVDLKGLRANNCYVQVKYSSSDWNWAKYKEPIAGFVKCLRLNPDARNEN